MDEAAVAEGFGTRGGRFGGGFGAGAGAEGDGDGVGVDERVDDGHGGCEGWSCRVLGFCGRSDLGLLGFGLLPSVVGESPLEKKTDEKVENPVFVSCPFELREWTMHCSKQRKLLYAKRVRILLVRDQDVRHRLSWFEAGSLVLQRNSKSFPSSLQVGLWCFSASCSSPLTIKSQAASLVDHFEDDLAVGWVCL